MYSKTDQVQLSKMMFDAAGVEVVPYNQKKDFSKSEVKTGVEELQKILKRYS